MKNLINILIPFFSKPEKTDNDWVTIGQAYHGMGAALLCLQQYDEAIDMLEKSIAIHSHVPLDKDNRFKESQSLSMIGDAYAKREDYHTAIDKMEQAIKVAHILCSFLNNIEIYTHIL